MGKKSIFIGILVVAVLIFLGWWVGGVAWNHAQTSGINSGPFQFNGFVRSVSGNVIKIGGPAGDWELDTAAYTKMQRPTSKTASGFISYAPMKPADFIKGLEVTVNLDSVMQPGVVSAVHIQNITAVVSFSTSTAVKPK